jgi:hypothetical protein
MYNMGKRSSGKNVSDTDRIENNAVNHSSTLAYVFAAAVTFLPSRCLATLRGYTNEHRLMKGIYKARRWDGLRRRNIYINFHIILQIFKKTGMGIPKTHRQRGNCIIFL